jgi:hypothetical protein
MVKCASMIAAVAMLSSTQASPGSLHEIQIIGRPLPQHDATEIVSLVKPHVPKGERVLWISVTSRREVDVYTGPASHFGGSVFSLRKRHSRWVIDLSVRGFWNE